MGHVVYRGREWYGGYTGAYPNGRNSPEDIIEHYNRKYGKDIGEIFSDSGDERCPEGQ